jgi:hypothetical protein
LEVYEKMGIFDFLRPRSKRTPNADARKELAAAFESLTGVSPPKPRPEHYYFAHHKLRTFAFANPEQCCGVLHSDEARNFLSEVWHAMKEGHTFVPTDPTLRFDDLRVHHATAGVYPAVFLEMPRPKYAPEAYFVGLVWQVMGIGDVMITRQPVLLYYTLELCGREEEGSLQPVFCEWTGDDRHHTHGRGPAAQLDAFVRHVDTVVAERVRLDSAQSTKGE